MSPVVCLLAVAIGQYGANPNWPPPPPTIHKTERLGLSRREILRRGRNGWDAYATHQVGVDGYPTGELRDAVYADALRWDNQQRLSALRPLRRLVVARACKEAWEVAVAGIACSDDGSTTLIHATRRAHNEMEVLTHWLIVEDQVRFQAPDKGWLEHTRARFAEFAKRPVEGIRPARYLQFSNRQRRLHMENIRVLLPRLSSVQAKRLSAWVDEWCGRDGS